jgi:catechol 2,3-dioxygenase
VALQGASDHIVSEAIYLADPEGNGIEVYADRPVSRWRTQNGEIRMATDPLDVQDLLKSAEGTEWSGFPEGGMVGHVHLQVGDTERPTASTATCSASTSPRAIPARASTAAAAITTSSPATSGTAAAPGRARRHGGPRCGRDRRPRRRQTSRGRRARRERRIPITTDTGGTTLHDPWGTAIILKV